MKKSLSLFLIVLLLSLFTLPPRAEAATPSTVTIKYDAVRIRSAASTASTILATVNRAKNYPYLATTAKDASGYAWYKISYSTSQVGFVREDLASLGYATSPAPIENPIGQLTVYAGTRLNVRQSYTVTSTKLGTIEDGTKHAYYATQSGWYKIKYGNGYGWVSGQYVKASSVAPIPQPEPTPLPSPVDEAQGSLTVNSASSALNVRATPSVYGTRLGSVADRTVHAYYATQSGWYKIKYGTGYGWVSGNYVLLGNTDDVSVTPELNVGPNLLFTAVADSPIMTLAQVTQYELKTKVELNLRAGADTSFAILSTLPKGVTLKREVLLENGWAQVSYKGSTGFVKADPVYVATIPVVWKEDAAFAALYRDQVSKSLGVAAVENALQQLTKPYQWGAEGPIDYDRDGDVNVGFDCSGLVQWAFWSEGKTLPRTTVTGYNTGLAVSREAIEIGDLIYFKTDDSSSPVDHVAMYFGNDVMLHATGAFGMTTLSNVYWDRMVTIRRHSR